MTQGLTCGLCRTFVATLILCAASQSALACTSAPARLDTREHHHHLLARQIQAPAQNHLDNLSGSVLTADIQQQQHLIVRQPFDKRQEAAEANVPTESAAQSDAPSELTVGALIPSTTAAPGDAGTETTATAEAGSSSTAAAVAPVDIPTLPAGYVMPNAFDAILGVNFTSQSCPDFFSTFLGDAAFKTCYPLSLLLETSTSFFKAMQNSIILPSVIQEMCSADAATCSSTVDHYATEIVKNSACGRDLAKGNALAVAALNGFQNYNLMRDAGCLKDDRTGNGQYCFAEAANATLANDLYLYYLPGGTGLPSGTQPTCDYCSKVIMESFSNYATNSTLRLSQTYAGARSVITLACGPSFAPLVAATTTKTSGNTATTKLASPAALFLAVLFWSIWSTA